MDQLASRLKAMGEYVTSNCKRALAFLDLESHDCKTSLHHPTIPGFKLEDGEMTRLLENVDLSHRGRVNKAAIAASQLDWKELQQRHAERWSSLVRHTFGELDADHDGFLKASDIIEVGA